MARSLRCFQRGRMRRRKRRIGGRRRRRRLLFLLIILLLRRNSNDVTDIPKRLSSKRRFSQKGKLRSQKTTLVESSPKSSTKPEDDNHDNHDDDDNFSVEEAGTGRLVYFNFINLQRRLEETFVANFVNLTFMYGYKNLKYLFLCSKCNILTENLVKNDDCAFKLQR